MKQRGTENTRNLKARLKGLAGRLGLLACGIAILTGCAGTVSTGYVGEPYYTDPYVYDYGPAYDVYVAPYPYYYHGRRYWEYSHRGVEHHRFGENHAVGGYHGTYSGHGHGHSWDRH